MLVTYSSSKTVTREGCMRADQIGFCTQPYLSVPPTPHELSMALQFTAVTS